MPLVPDDTLLRGKVAVVTGAAVGIGRAVAVALAEFGADVAVCDRDEANLSTTATAVTATGRAVEAGVLDVRDGDAVAAFVARVGERFGKVDVLVNNAGGGFAAAFLDASAKGQQALVDENFSSVTHFVRGIVPLMPPPPEGGSIVNVTSIEAHRAAPGFAVYAAQKAAVANLTKSLALELGDRCIRVNCVAPDMIPTPGVGDLPGPPRTPLPVRGHADDVAGAVVYLAGRLARFVTGTTVHVDGGNLAAAGWRRSEEGWAT
jgi:3-oxoacyl-[acyl-carrier protein] reductase